MKRSLLLFLAVLWTAVLSAQCVPTCSDYVSTSITYSQFPYGGTDVVSQLSPNLDDGNTSQIPIGFTFTFYCNSYTDVYICSNGFIQFDYGPLLWPQGPYVHPTQPVPDPLVPNGMIAFNMTDLDPNSGGSITYTTVGTAPNRMFVVTYSNVPAFGSTTDMNTGQIVLYETSNIIEIHTTVANGAANQSYKGTQGIENEAGTKGTPSSLATNNSASWLPASSIAYRFLPAYIPTPPPAISGNTFICEGDVNTYSTSLPPTASNLNWSAPPLWVGTGTNAAVTYTAGPVGSGSAQVTMSVSATYTCGTSESVTLAIDVMPAPFVGITGSPAIICSGETVTLTTSGANTYTIIPLGSSGTPPFYDVPMVTTSYSVLGTSIDGCLSQNNAQYAVTVKTTPTVTVNSGDICDGAQFTLTPTGAASYALQGTSFYAVQPPPGVHTYTIIGTTNGCVGTPVISTVNVHDLPTINVTSPRTTICSKEKTTITATGASSLVWFDNSTAPTLTVAPTTSTVYNVTGTDAFGCVNTGSIVISITGCVGLEEQNSLLAEVSLFPNPASANVSVNTPLPAKLIILDLQGRTVYETSIGQGVSLLKLDHLAAATYLVKVQTDQAVKTMVFVKE